MANTDLLIPATLAAEIEAAANEENRPVADVLRDAVVGYLENRRWRSAEEDPQTARKLGLAEDDSPPSDEYRRSISDKIAVGVASAKQGHLVDGEAVFVRVEAELRTLEAKER
jgi:hypothetical protein